MPPRPISRRMRNSPSRAGGREGQKVRGGLVDELQAGEAGFELGGEVGVGLEKQVLVGVEVGEILVEDFGPDRRWGWVGRPSRGFRRARAWGRAPVRTGGPDRDSAVLLPYQGPDRGGMSLEKSGEGELVWVAPRFAHCTKGFSAGAGDSASEKASDMSR